MKDDSENARANRLKEAVENGPLNMNEIAERLGVARTSVLNWKRRGSINLDNLRGIAELTGYRFWWLAFGEGPKKSEDSDSGTDIDSPLMEIARQSPEHSRMVANISHLTAARVLTPAIAEAISGLLSAFSASRKD